MWRKREKAKQSKERQNEEKKEKGRIWAARESEEESLGLPRGKF